LVSHVNAPNHAVADIDEVGQEEPWQNVAACFKALAHPNRLKLLEELARPRTVREIELHPARDGERDRVLTTQGVRHHLRQLEECGLVRVADSRQLEGTNFTYESDPRRLFQAAELALALASGARAREWPRNGNGNGSGSRGHTPRGNDVSGPRLTLCHGVDSGRVFSLRRADLPGEDLGWVIGNGAEAHVSLEYDRDVASHHCEILPTSDGFELLDLRASSGSTHLNWERRQRGGEAELAHGDMIGVGRSLLLFHT
jgi:DNA-binding transcriptional ArsR family regulator